MQAKYHRARRGEKKKKKIPEEQTRELSRVIAEQKSCGFVPGSDAASWKRRNREYLVVHQRVLHIRNYLHTIVFKY